MSEFVSALSLTPDPERRDEYTGSLGGGWGIGNAINGGLVESVALAGLQRTVEAQGGHGDLLVASAFFLSAAAQGPARVRADVLRTGRSMSTGQVSLTQEVDGAQVERVRVIATLGDLTLQSEPVYRAAEPPPMPPPEKCLRAERGSSPHAAPIALLDRVDLRFDPETAGWAWGQPSGAGELRAWIRFADGAEPDLASLPFFVDALPPVTFDLGAIGWAPTLELTTHVRAVPAPGWLRLRVTTSNVAGGLLEEDVVIWDAADRVVAQSRQLAGVRMPSADPQT